jgi:hypothetical protein
MWPPGQDADEEDGTYVSPFPPGPVRIIEDGGYEARARRRAPGVKAARELWEAIQVSLTAYARTLTWR